MQYVIRDFEDREIGRANDARSAPQLIEARWPGAVVVSPDGTMIRGWMNLSILLQASLNADFATGRNGNRPSLKRLLQDARAGKFETVVIIRIDRIMRRLSNLYQLYQDMEVWNVRLVATDRDLDTNTTAGRLTFSLLGLLAQWEVEQTSDRVKDGLKKAKKAGKRIGRPQARVDVEKAQVLLAAGLPKTRVAEMLGVPRSTLNRHLAVIESDIEQRL